MGGTTHTIGQDVVFRVDRDSHVLPDGQDVTLKFTNWPAVQ